MSHPAITVDDHERPVRVEVEGDLDLEGGDELEAAVLPLVGPGARIEVACDRIGFVDSSGLAALVEVAQLVHDQGGRLLLVDPSPRLQAVLDLTRTRELFAIEGSDARPPAWRV